MPLPCRRLYSSNPPAQVATGDRRVQRHLGSSLLDRPESASHEADASFSRKRHSRECSRWSFRRRSTPARNQTLYVTEGQLWQKQAETWRVAGTKRSDATKLQQPASTSKVIYAPGVDAHAEIKHALELAAKGHKRVLVVFGANWCYDCHVLDLAFHRPDVAGRTAAEFRSGARRCGRRRQKPGPDDSSTKSR